MSVTAKDDQGLGYAVRGDTNDGIAVVGVSGTGHGVYGECHSTRGGVGVFGKSDTGDSVRGETSGPHKGGAVGINTNPDVNSAGPGVYGESSWSGVWGVSHNFHGVVGESRSPSKAGVYGSSDWVGVWGISNNYHGVAGIANSPNGAGVYGKGTRAGQFDGDVSVNGTLNVTVDIVLQNADCAEEFDIAPAASGCPAGVDPGTVMVLAGEGALRASFEPYDKRVAGIVSGAGDYQPGIVLDRQPGAGNRQPIALMGKVFCKVDAGYGPVEIGDLLTTSPTPGHAMKAADPTKAFGAVIGKALRPLDAGRGLIPVLVSLQ